MFESRLYPQRKLNMVYETLDPEFGPYSLRDVMSLKIQPIEGCEDIREILAKHGQEFVYFEVLDRLGCTIISAKRYAYLATGADYWSVLFLNWNKRRWYDANGKRVPKR